jgi:hypothetical protein
LGALDSNKPTMLQKDCCLDGLVDMGLQRTEVPGLSLKTSDNKGKREKERAAGDVDTRARFAGTRMCTKSLWEQHEWGWVNEEAR